MYTNKNKRTLKINVTRCRDCRSAKTIETRLGLLHKTVQYTTPLYINFLMWMERSVGWGCILNCFMLSSLPCLCVCWSANPSYILLHFYITLFMSLLLGADACLSWAATLFSQASYICSIGWRIVDQVRLSSNTPCTPTVFLNPRP